MELFSVFDLVSEFKASNKKRKTIKANTFEIKHLTKSAVHFRHESVAESPRKRPIVFQASNKIGRHKE